MKRAEQISFNTLASSYILVKRQVSQYQVSSGFVATPYVTNLQSSRGKAQPSAAFWLLNYTSSWFSKNMNHGLFSMAALQFYKPQLPWLEIQLFSIGRHITASGSIMLSIPTETKYLIALVVNGWGGIESEMKCSVLDQVGVYEASVSLTSSNYSHRRGCVARLPAFVCLLATRISDRLSCFILFFSMAMDGFSRSKIKIIKSKKYLQ